MILKEVEVMKGKAISTVLVILLISFIIQLKVPSAVKASPITITVPTDYTTIQAAINAASPGDTVFVEKGTYYENIVVNKRITLTGESMEGTIIDGSGSGSTVYVTGNDVVISGFTITDGFYGIDLYYSSGNNITGNIVTNNYYDIELDYSSGNGIIGNTVTANSADGIWLYSSSNNRITGNTVTGNSYGIGLKSSSNHNSIVENTITANSVIGIYLDSSLNNRITGNTVTPNSNTGIDLYNSNSSIITGNTVTKSGCGIWLYSSSSNSIYHNNFINNYWQFYSSGHPNTWDNGYPSGGNYWSDYTGVDSNHDGIGDTPYTIDVNNVDRYPLMGIWVAPTPVPGIIPVAVSSNATVTSMDITPNTLSFDVSGPSGHGYVLVVFPRGLNTTDITVSVDGHILIPPPFPVITSNSTHYFIYFEIALSSHSVIITYATAGRPPVFVVPEYPFGVMMAVVAGFAALGTLRLKRRRD
jgi:parallel beta-helix repeat protein